MNLLIPAIFVNLITLAFFLHSKLHDSYLLLIMIIGQLILIDGEVKKNREKIQVSHILFTVTLLIGLFYFNEFHNKIFILIVLGITLSTRYIYSECAFNLSNDHYKFDFEKYIEFINWGDIYKICFFIIIYRIINDCR